MISKEQAEEMLAKIPTKIDWFTSEQNGDPFGEYVGVISERYPNSRGKIISFYGAQYLAPEMGEAVAKLPQLLRSLVAAHDGLETELDREAIEDVHSAVEGYELFAWVEDPFTDLWHISNKCRGQDVMKYVRGEHVAVYRQLPHICESLMELTAPRPSAEP